MFVRRKIAYGLAVAVIAAAVPAMAARTSSLEAMVALMGVGNPHAFASKATVSATPEWREWADLYSREPYPNMGIGTVHGPQVD